MGYKPTSSKNTLYYPQEKRRTSNTFHTQTISTLIAEWEGREKELTVPGQEGEEGRIIPRRLSAKIQNLADLFERKDEGVMGVSERQPGSRDPEPIIPTFGILGEGGNKPRKVRVVRREGCEGGCVDTHWQQHQPNEREILIIIIRIIVYLTEQRNLGVSQSSDSQGFIYKVDTDI